jgi:hypothetical protein
MIILVLAVILGLGLVIGVITKRSKNKRKLEIIGKLDEHLDTPDSYKDFISDLMKLNDLSVIESNVDYLIKVIGWNKKYGEEITQKLVDKQYFLGMSKEHLYLIRTDKPTNIEKEVKPNKSIETVIYGNKNSGDVFKFENDSLVTYKDR